MWCSTYHCKWNDMYYPCRIVLPSNILKFILLYMKQPWVHYPNLCVTRIRYQTFSKGSHQSLRVEINLQYHYPMVDINDKQKSIPIFHQPKTTVWQSPPLALMETLSHDNIHAYTPHKCFYLSPFNINGKGYLPLGLLPLTELSLGLLPVSTCLWFFFVFISLWLLSLPSYE